MNLKSLPPLLRAFGSRAHLAVLRDVKPFLRLSFLQAATSAGLLKNLTEWTSRDELARKLDVKRAELLGALLDLGVVLGELARKGDRYRIRGLRSSALVAAEADPLVAMIQGYGSYYGRVYQELAGVLAGGPLGSYLDSHGWLVARSSRMLEPFMFGFVAEVASKRRPLRLLEIGCGAGTYLRHAAAANPEATGIGIDLDEDVVAKTAASLSSWGLSGRFQILKADIRSPPEALSGPFDLITLYNNIYYFPVEERPALLRSLRARLSPGGALAITSTFRGDSLIGANLDVVLQSTSGCSPLPDLGELTAQLRASGFNHVRKTRLIPIEPFYGLEAS